MKDPPWVRLEGAAFRDELVRYKMANHPFRTHPFFAEVESGKAPRELLHRWVTQFYPWLACVPLAMAERFSRCSWEARFDPYRRMILDQLVEEAGDPKGKEPGHPELWLRFCEGLGLPRGAVVGATLLPSTLVAIDDFLYLNREVPFYISAAGSSEPPNVELCARLLPAFRTHYKVNEAHLAYYTLHVTADEEHSRFVGQMAADFATTPEVRKEMWDAMLRGFALHRLLVDGAIGSAHVPPPP
ncbi:MAG: iron-containing redox enzyme family protein [Thermoplasmata archaeon]|nr:iron-containing redox enzyme family protein [Thermoplasmata archaeon]